MANSGPLIFLFDDEAAVILDRFRAFFSVPNPLFRSTGSDTSLREFSILIDGVSLELRIIEPPKSNTYRQIFSDYDVNTARCAADLKFNAHTAGGQRIPPIALALLSAGAAIAEALTAKAVLWSPASLLSDTDYFAEAVNSYRNGGVFPALSLVDFEIDEQRSTLMTSGLSWFSGQELKLECTGLTLDRVELIKRAVRLVHDIAVNGPVLEKQMVADLVPEVKIALSIEDAAVLVCANVIFDENHKLMTFN